jgi:drug/metabolite transporter (DMT)-like permease
MEIWILITIFAALFQSIRTAAQKHINTDLSAMAVTWIRSGCGLPIVLVYFFLLCYTSKNELNFHMSTLFYIFAGITAFSQIFATWLMVSLFSQRNFATGITYAKSEALQTALLSFILFSSYFSLLSILAIILGSIGLICISISKQQATRTPFLRGYVDKSALIGVSSGTLFAISCIFARQASLILGPNSNAFYKAALTLVVVLLIQTIVIGIYLLVKERNVFYKISKQWKCTVLIGLTSALGSIGWFTAFALQSAAYVKTLGQIELFFALIISYQIFKERFTFKELLGMGLVVASIVLLLL